jgi:predicted nucleotidyltransferase
MAASNLGIQANPSNFEVAEELDRLTDELEGNDKEIRLVEMRHLAKNIMNKIKDFEPRLIGSVWRGTARSNSDIDIIAFSFNHKEIEEKLYQYKIVEKGEVIFKNGIKVYRLKLLDKYPIEVIVLRTYEYHPERCSIYGDFKTGITLPDLEKLLLYNPQRKLIPRKKPR